MKKQAPIVKRLTTTPWDKGLASVMLDGVKIAELHSTPQCIWVTINGKPWGGSEKLSTALRRVAQGYQQSTGQWEV